MQATVCYECILRLCQKTHTKFVFSKVQLHTVNTAQTNDITYLIPFRMLMEAQCSSSSLKPLLTPHYSLMLPQITNAPLPQKPISNPHQSHTNKHWGHYGPLSGITAFSWQVILTSWHHSHSHYTSQTTTNVLITALQHIEHHQVHFFVPFHWLWHHWDWHALYLYLKQQCEFIYTKIQTEKAFGTAREAGNSQRNR